MPPVPDPGPRAPDLRLVLPASPDQVRAALARITAAPPLAGLPDDRRATVELVLAEVLNNVAEHAYAAGPGLVDVALWVGATNLSCEIVDSGAAMPQGRLPEGRLAPGAGLPLAEQPEGGFGWHLIRSLTRDLDYDRTDGRNRLRFVIPLAG